jgi:hypothetical protein
MDSEARNGIPEGLVTCRGPFCDVQFEQTGMKIKPRRYCCDECKVEAWIMARAVKLLADHPEAHLPELDAYALRQAKALCNRVGIVEFNKRMDEA